jgi:hypothetical protein
MHWLKNYASGSHLVHWPALAVVFALILAVRIGARSFFFRLLAHKRDRGIRCLGILARKRRTMKTETCQATATLRGKRCQVSGVSDMAVMELKARISIFKKNTNLF